MTPKGSWYNKALEFYHQGLNDSKIAAKCEVSQSAVTRWRNALSLPKNYYTDTERQDAARGFALSADEQEKYSRVRSRLLKILHDMISRCDNPNAVNYSRYGAVGVTVCDEWKRDKYSFVAWALSNGYAERLQIDRKDTYKGYSPENCRWITCKENNRNRKDNRLLSVNGESRCVAEWAEICGVPYKYLSHLVLKMGRGVNNAIAEREILRILNGGEPSKYPRNSIMLSVNGVTQPAAIWSKESGVKLGTIHNWIYQKGKEHAEARIADTLKRGYLKKAYKNNVMLTVGGETMCAKDWATKLIIDVNKIYGLKYSQGIEYAERMLSNIVEERRRSACRQ
jgi:transposase